MKMNRDRLYSLPRRWKRSSLSTATVGISSGEKPSRSAACIHYTLDFFSSPAVALLPGTVSLLLLEFVSHGRAGHCPSSPASRQRSACLRFLSIAVLIKDCSGQKTIYPSSNDCHTGQICGILILLHVATPHLHGQLYADARKYLNISYSQDTTTTSSARRVILRSLWANADALLHQQDSEKNTILCLLASVKNTATNYLNQSLAEDIELQLSAIRMGRLYWERFPFITDWCNQQGKTATHIAALHGRDEFVRVHALHYPKQSNLCPVQFLCEIGADIDLSDTLGNCPLH